MTARRVADGDLGFTLIEVMISLAVAGALLVTLLYTLGANLSAADRQEEAAAATCLAKEKLREARITQAPGAGRFPAPNDAFGYEVRLGASRYPGLVELVVSVSGKGERATLFELVRERRAG